MVTGAGRPVDHASAGTDSSERRSDPLRSAVAALLVFVLSVAVYAPTLEGPFVWDDELLIPRSDVATLQPLSAYFSSAYWLATDTQAEPSYYRPMSVFSLALDHALHGENPAGFHLTNLLLHGACSVLVLALGRRLGARLPSATVAALLFAWFPRLSEATAWISGRTDLLAAFFSLAALLTILGKSPAKFWLASGLSFLALASKEVALATALAGSWYAWRQTREKGPRERARSLSPFLLLGGLYAALRSSVLGAALTTGELTLGQRLLAPFEALGRYAVMLACGWQPRFNIGHLALPDWRYATLGALVAVALGVAALRWRPRREHALLALTSALGIGLVIHILPYQSSVSTADRFLYLPLGAAAPVLAHYLSQMRSPIPLGAAFALALSYLPFAWQRAQVWGDDILFWGTAIREQDARLNAMSHTGLASILVRHGMYDEALRTYERIQPGDRATFLLAVEQHATVLTMNGDTDEALNVLERAAAAHPSPRLLKTLALSYAGAGKGDRAEDAAARFEAQVRDPREGAEVRETVARILHARGAVAGPESDSAPDPQPASLQQRLAHSRRLAQVGRSRVAMREFLSTIADPGMTPHELRAILVFALSYGTPREVNLVHEHLLTLDPTTPEDFSLLVAERNDRVERLRRLCRELNIPTTE